MVDDIGCFASLGCFFYRLPGDCWERGMAAVIDLSLDQGATWVQTFIWQDVDEVPFDLSTHTARAQIRSRYADDDVGGPAASIVGETFADGRVVLALSDVETAAIHRGRYYYDVEVVSSGGFVTRLVQGRLTVLGEVTRG
jgi:hypothetical protein